MPRKIIEIVLVFLVFYAHGAWAVPDSNEPYYLGKAIHFWNPNWVPNDPFLQTPDSHSVFYFTFGWLSLFLSPYHLAWAGRFITWAFLAYSWRRLSFSLVSVPFMSILTAASLVYFIDRFQMAGEWLVGGVEGKGIAFGFVFLALESLVKGHWNRVWIFLGFGSAFHVLVGGWSVVASLFATRRGIVGIIIGGCIAMFGLVPVLMLDYGASAETIAEARHIYVFERLSHHLVPQAFPPTFIARFAVLTLIWLFLCRQTDERFLRLQRFISGTLFIAAFGFFVSFCLGTEQQASLLRFYFFRMSDIAVPIGVSLGGAAAFFAVCRGIATEYSLHPPLFRAGICYLALGVFAFLLVHWLLFGLGLFPFHGSDTAIAWGVVLLIGGVFLRRIPVALILVYASLTLYGPFEHVLWHATLRTEAMYSRIEPPNTAKDWIKACRWIKDSDIPKTSRFLVPRESATFKWHARRPDVGVWKEIPQDAASIVRWHKTMKTLFGGLDADGNISYDFPVQALLKARSPRELQILKKEYEIEFILCGRYPTLPFQKVYENDRYVVYALEF